MTRPDRPVPRRAPASGIVRRVATTVIVSGIVFVAMWLMAFSLLTSFIVSSGCCVILVAASAVFDAVETIVDAIAAIVFGVLGAIAAVFAAIVALFGF